MTNDNWIALIGIACSLLVVIGACLIREAMRITAAMAVFRNEFQHIDEHIDDCVADRKSLWNAVPPPPPVKELETHA